MLRSAVLLRTTALRAPTAARTTTTAAAAAAALSRTPGRFAPSRAIWTRAPAARLRLGPQVRAYSAGGALSKQDVEDRIVGLLRGFDKVNDPSKITSSSHFANDLGLDSLDTVEVVMAIEEEFSIEIPDKDADAIHSVGQAIEYIINQPDAH